MIPAPLARTIELAFFDTTRSCSKVAQLFSTLKQPVHARDVRRIWDDAREAGRLPKVPRKLARPVRRTI